MTETDPTGGAPRVRPAVSPTRRKTGLILIPIILIVLGICVWQTWDYWGPEPKGGEYQSLPSLPSEPDSMRARPGSMPASRDATEPGEGPEAPAPATKEGTEK